jgi:hypothetical protein
MTEVLLFHHAQGQTEGFKAFADELRGARHTVHTPDLLDGRTFGSIPEGMAYVRQLGFGEITDRGERAAAELPNELVYAGMSLGVVPAQKLAQTRSGARGAIFLYSCRPSCEFGTCGTGFRCRSTSPLTSERRFCPDTSAFHPSTAGGAWGCLPSIRSCTSRRRSTTPCRIATVKLGFSIRNGSK